MSFSAENSQKRRILPYNFIVLVESSECQGTRKRGDLPAIVPWSYAQKRMTVTQGRPTLRSLADRTGKRTSRMYRRVFFRCTVCKGQNRGLNFLLDNGSIKGMTVLGLR